MFFLACEAVGVLWASSDFSGILQSPLWPSESDCPSLCPPTLPSRSYGVARSVGLRCPPTHNTQVTLDGVQVLHFQSTLS